MIVDALRDIVVPRGRPPCASPRWPFSYSCVGSESLPAGPVPLMPNRLWSLIARLALAPAGLVDGLGNRHRRGNAVLALRGDRARCDGVDERLAGVVMSCGAAAARGAGHRVVGRGPSGATSRRAGAGVHRQTRPVAAGAPGPRAWLAPVAPACDSRGVEPSWRRARPGAAPHRLGMRRSGELARGSLPAWPNPVARLARHRPPLPPETAWSGAVWPAGRAACSRRPGRRGACASLPGPGRARALTGSPHCRMPRPGARCAEPAVARPGWRPAPGASCARARWWRDRGARGAACARAVWPAGRARSPLLTNPTTPWSPSGARYLWALTEKSGRESPPTVCRTPCA